MEGGREAEAIGAGEAAQAIGADEAVPEVQAIGADGAAQAIGADGADPEAQAIGAGRAELFQQLKRLMQVVAGYFDRDTLTLENQWEQLNPNQNIQPNGAPIVPPNIHDVYDYIVGLVEYPLIISNLDLMFQNPIPFNLLLLLCNHTNANP